MRDDQVVRITVALAIAIGYAARTHGAPDAAVVFGGIETSALVVFCTFELAIAFPEIIDTLPYLRSKSD